MQKRAFTLIELIVSVIILSLIVTFLYSGLGTLKNSTAALFKKDNKRKSALNVKKLFILDIMQSSELNISKTKSKNIDFIFLYSKNSLYGIYKPQIYYFVDKKNRLIRSEGVNYKLPLNEENLYNIKYDVILKDIEFFKLYKNKKKNLILIIIKQKKKPMNYFEIYNNNAT